MRPVIVLFGALLLVMALPAVVFANDSPPALGPGFYDDRVPVIVYGGDGAVWDQLENSNYYLQTQTRSRSVNAEIQFAIWGDGLVIYATHFPPTSGFTGGGDYLLCITSPDQDESCLSLSQYSSALSYQFATEITGLGPGIHQIRMVSQDDGQFGLDAIHVLPPVPDPIDPNAITVSIEELPPPAWLTLTDPDDEDGQIYAVDYSLRPSDTAIIVLLAGVLMSNLITLAYSMWKAR